VSSPLFGGDFLKDVIILASFKKVTQRNPNMAKFRCKASGNIVEFTLQHDIDSMVGHDAYEEVDDDGETIEYEVEETSHEIPLTAPVGIKKTRGRPKKA